MNLEHLELVEQEEYPELSEVITEDMHVIDYDDGKFHCSELFTHEGAYRGYAKTKDEAIHNAVELYKKSHEKDKTQ